MRGERLSWRAVKKSHEMTAISAKSGRRRKAYLAAKGRAASRRWCRSSVIMAGREQGKVWYGYYLVSGEQRDKVR